MQDFSGYACDKSYQIAEKFVVYLIAAGDDERAAWPELPSFNTAQLEFISCGRSTV
jgi:hypothetical protein